VRGRVTNRINQDLGLPRNAPSVSAFTLTLRRFASRFRLHSSVFALKQALFEPPNAKQKERKRGVGIPRQILSQMRDVEGGSTDPRRRP